MKRIDIVIVAYSLLLLIGGFIGYIVASSVASLVMSTIFAILLIGSIFLSRAMAYRSRCVLIAALILFFGYRWYSAAKFMPAGLSCTLSVVVLAAVFLLSSKNGRQ